MAILGSQSRPTGRNYPKSLKDSEIDREVSSVNLYWSFYWRCKESWDRIRLMADHTTWEATYSPPWGPRTLLFWVKHQHFSKMWIDDFVQRRRCFTSALRAALPKVAKNGITAITTGHHFHSRCCFFSRPDERGGVPVRVFLFPIVC